MKRADMIVRDEDGGVYDFSKAVRGRHAHLVGCSSFRLASELHPHFETSEQVAAALHQWVAEHRPPRQEKRAYLDPATPGARFVGEKSGLVVGFWFARDLAPFFPTEASVNRALSEWLAEHPPRRRRRRAARA